MQYLFTYWEHTDSFHTKKNKSSGFETLCRGHVRLTPNSSGYG